MLVERAGAAGKQSLMGESLKRPTKWSGKGAAVFAVLKGKRLSFQTNQQLKPNQKGNIMQLSISELNIIKKALQNELNHVEQHPKGALPEWLVDAHNSHLALIKKAIGKISRSATLKAMYHGQV